MKTLFTFLLLASLAQAQNYKEDLRAALQNMGSLDRYSLRIHYRLYLDGKLNKAFQESSSLVKKNGDKLYCSQSNGLEFISTNKYTVWLDRSTHEITVKRQQEAVGAYLTEVWAGAAKNIDTLLSVYNKVKLVKTEKNKVTYQLDVRPGSSLKAILICIDREQKLLVNIRYTYKEDKPIRELKNSKHSTLFEISYEDVHLNTPVNEDLFNENKYLAFERGKIKPAKKYAGYILNLLN